MIKFSERKITREIIDDFNMKGDHLEQNLDEIEWINKNLGGTKTSALPILYFLQKSWRKETIIVDIGCGSGDVLKYLHDACNSKIEIKLIGVDANANIIDYARKKHFMHTKVNFIHADIMHNPQQIPAADVYMLNLFLHHFEMSDINAILNSILTHKPALVVVNDLQRSRISYILFAILCYLKNASFVTFNDGRLSILKGFSRSEMRSIAANAKGYKITLKWRWAFRWQLICERN